MDTSILHTRMNEYQQKAKHPMQKEMIGYFKNWLYSLENYISELEMENYDLVHNITNQQERIEILAQLLIITGNSDKLVRNSELIKEAVNLLANSKDRHNHRELGTISILLKCAKTEGVVINTLKDLKDYASRG